VPPKPDPQPCFAFFLLMLFLGRCASHTWFGGHSGHCVAKAAARLPMRSPVV
jgi:hypothetical protein